MVVKTSQLKKFLVKELKSIIKEHKLGKVSKLKKPQLLALILNAPNSKDIMSKLAPKIKKKKKFSAKQLASQAKFKAMVANKKKDPSKPVNKGEDDKELKERLRLGSKTMSELKDIAFDKGLKVPNNVEFEDLIKIIMFGKQNLKAFEQKAIVKRQTKPVKSKKKKEALQEINKMMKELIEVKALAPIENKKELEKLGKKLFLDNIFGVSKFSLKNEIKDIVNEASDEQLEIFLSFTKDMKKQVLEKRFNSSKSIGQLLNSFIK